jgi:hypothetical protein
MRCLSLCPLSPGIGGEVRIAHPTSQAASTDTGTPLSAALPDSTS